MKGFFFLNRELSGEIVWVQRVILYFILYKNLQKICKKCFFIENNFINEIFIEEEVDLKSMK